MRKKIYYWTEEFDSESFAEFIDFQNAIDEDENFEVWLDCDGGNCAIAEMLRVLFESFPKDKFTLVGAGKICSAALDLFAVTKCAKTLVPGTVGMAHTITRQMPVDKLGNSKLRYSEEKLISNKYSLVEEFEQKLPNVVNDSDMRKYLDNQDIWLSTEEIQKFLT